MSGLEEAIEDSFTRIKEIEKENKMLKKQIAFILQVLISKGLIYMLDEDEE